MRARLAVLAFVFVAQTAAAHMIVDVKMSIVAPSFAPSRQRLTYQVIADNRANDNAFGVVVTDVLPSTAAFVKAAGSGWSCSQAKGTVTCSAEQMPPGENVITIDVTAPSATGPITNSASVESLGSIDPITSNDKASATTTVYDAASCSAATLQITQPAENSTSTSPARLTWTAVPNAKSYAIYSAVEGERSALAATSTDSSATVSFERGNVEWHVEAILGTCPNVVSSTRHFFSDARKSVLTLSRLNTNETLDAPTGVAIDSSGNVFVTDGSSIRMVSRGEVTTMSGSPSIAGAADGRPASFSDPAGIVITTFDDFAYIADRGNHAVRIRYPGDPTLGYVITIGGALGQPGIVEGNSEVSRFSSPSAVAADPRGRLYVADTGNDRVRKMTSVPGYVGYYATATFATGLKAPQGIAVDGETIVYIADTGNNAIRKIVNGVMTTIAEQLNAPTALAVDARGNLYVCETGDNAIRKISPSGAMATVATNLDHPRGITIDASGTIYIANSGAREILVAHLATAAGDRRRAVRP